LCEADQTRRWTRNLKKNQAWRGVPGNNDSPQDWTWCTTLNTFACTNEGKIDRGKFLKLLVDHDMLAHWWKNLLGCKCKHSNIFITIWRNTSYSFSFAWATIVANIIKEMVTHKIKYVWVGLMMMTWVKVQTKFVANTMLTCQCEDRTEVNEKTCVCSCETCNPSS
jgi:hypothetical protein